MHLHFGRHILNFLRFQRRNLRFSWVHRAPPPPRSPRDHSNYMYLYTLVYTHIYMKYVYQPCWNAFKALQNSFGIRRVLYGRWSKASVAAAAVAPVVVYFHPLPIPSTPRPPVVAVCGCLMVSLRFSVSERVEHNARARLCSAVLPPPARGHGTALCLLCSLRHGERAHSMCLKSKSNKVIPSIPIPFRKHCLLL